MVKTLQKHGNGHALVIERPLMEAMGITANARLQVAISGQSLIITPVKTGVGRQAVAASVSKLRRRYGGMLKKLAE
jgi:antitoxin component of MazEF toxin-antitoxin module